MDEDAFLTIVEQASGVGREAAERAAHAVLQTLADRIDAGEARDLAAQLPPSLAPWLATATPAQSFDRDEFLRRVAERASVDAATAEQHARAVFSALSRAVSPKEWADMAAELPGDYAPLLARGPVLDVLDADTFVDRVSKRASLDHDAARRATEAVLETLAVRIAGGEIEDLVARLPAELHDPLRRGRERSPEQPAKMSLDEFVAQVAQLEGSNPFDAREHARAVLRTLREAVGDEEFFDVKVQLPQDYAAVLA
jgi:uncharacterized protein (DUF2267 family)